MLQGLEFLGFRVCCFCFRSVAQCFVPRWGSLGWHPPQGPDGGPDYTLRLLLSSTAPVARNRKKIKHPERNFEQWPFAWPHWTLRGFLPHAPSQRFMSQRACRRDHRYMREHLKGSMHLINLTARHVESQRLIPLNPKPQTVNPKPQVPA